MRYSFSTILAILLLSSTAVAQSETKTEKEAVDQTLGVIRAPLGRVKQDSLVKASLGVRVKAEKRCTFSDFDAIAFDAMHMPERRIIISLESVVENDNSFPNQSILLDNPNTLVKKGINLDFSFPFLKKSNLVGIFICSDSRNEGRCNTQNKEIADYGEIFRFYSEIPPKGYTPPDRIFYFRPLVVSPKQAVFATRQMSKTRYPLQKRFLEEELDMFIPPNMYERIESLSKKLTSMPLRNIVGRIAVDLPVYNASRCAFNNVDSPEASGKKLQK